MVDVCLDQGVINDKISRKISGVIDCGWSKDHIDLFWSKVGHRSDYLYVVSRVRRETWTGDSYGRCG